MTPLEEHNVNPSALPMALPERVHLVGAAGAGMRALASVLSQSGCLVSGSDLQPSEASDAGVVVALGHDAERVTADLDMVIHSPAIAADNPELCQAHRLGVPVVSYPQLLGRLMSSRHGLSVAGTHGKSTTVAMTAEILGTAGLDPTVVGGGTPIGQSSGGRYGRGVHLLVEACEYRAHFHELQPNAAAVLNIEPDHFDYYHTPEQLEAAFAHFARQIPADGLVVRYADCPTTMRVTSDLACPSESFGLSAGADWRALGLEERRGKYQFEIYRGRLKIGDVRLATPGKHNVLNALAAAALAHHAGVSGEAICRGLSRFRGLRRRLEVVALWQKVLVIDDYAHHPTEISATLSTIRQLAPGRRLWCVFQPHQELRTARLLDALARSLQNADKIIVAEIFRARENLDEPARVTAADLAACAAGYGAKVLGVHEMAEIREVLDNQLRPGDVLVTMGAGDIGNIAHGIAQRVRENCAA